MKSHPCLLNDFSIEIPPFLLRKPDGTLLHPKFPIPLIHEGVELSLPLGDGGKLICEADRIARAEILAQQVRGDVVDEQYDRQKRAAQTVERDVRKEQLRQNKIKQRQVFMQHFKWDIDF